MIDGFQYQFFQPNISNFEIIGASESSPFCNKNPLKFIAQRVQQMNLSNPIRESHKVESIQQKTGTRSSTTPNYIPEIDRKLIKKLLNFLGNYKTRNTNK
jgi:hypothetical protein